MELTQCLLDKMSMSYDEDDMFNQTQKNDLNQENHTCQMPVWSNNWDLERQFKLHIRSDYLTIKAKCKVPHKK